MAASLSRGNHIDQIAMHGQLPCKIHFNCHSSINTLITNISDYVCDDPDFLFIPTINISLLSDRVALGR